MAERSTAAVDVADTGGEEPLPAKADQATADGAATAEDSSPQRSSPREADSDETAAEQTAEMTAGIATGAASRTVADAIAATAAQHAPGKAPTNGTANHTANGTASTADGTDRSAAPAPAELHSGHKLARRYRLEECVTRLDGFSSWRAVDEKLRRAVGVHLLPSDHSRARSVLAASRSSALLGDPRFVQVLDAVEDGGLVYVVHEWLPDAVDLTTLLASGPLEPHEAYQMVSHVSWAMAAAHREGLSHLRLTPNSVLRTSSGQWRIRGLAVNAALRGISSKSPQARDTEAIGALLYAALTQRWPYANDAFGLSGLPKGVGLIAPDQVRAGVHRGLSELAMRALVNEGATASRQEQPCTSTDDLVKAVAELPRIRPPEPAFTPPPDYRRTTYQQGYGRTATRGMAVPAGPAPGPLDGRTGRVLKWSVAALLIAALGLGSWQLADALLDRGTGGGSTGEGEGEKGSPVSAGKPLPISGSEEYYPDGNPQHAGDAGLTHDGDPATSWNTYSFHDGPALAPYKDGVGVVYDLGSEKQVSGASVGLRFAGDHTAVELYATDSLSSATPLSGMEKITEGRTGSRSLKLDAGKPVTTRYVLVWLTALPYASGGSYGSDGYRQALTEVTFTG